MNGFQQNNLVLIICKSFVGLMVLFAQPAMDVKHGRWGLDFFVVLFANIKCPL